jgi:hypothetical protein
LDEKALHCRAGMTMQATEIDDLSLEETVLYVLEAVSASLVAEETVCGVEKVT